MWWLCVVGSPILLQALAPQSRGVPPGLPPSLRLLANPGRGREFPLSDSHLHLQQLPLPQARRCGPGELAFLNPKPDLGVMSRGMPTGQLLEREIKDF